MLFLLFPAAVVDFFRCVALATTLLCVPSRGSAAFKHGTAAITNPIIIMSYRSFCKPQIARDGAEVFVPTSPTPPPPARHLGSLTCCRLFVSSNRALVLRCWQGGMFSPNNKSDVAPLVPIHI